VFEHLILTLQDKYAFSVFENKVPQKICKSLTLEANTNIKHTVNTSQFVPFP